MPKKKSQFTDADDALLEELGVEVEVKKKAQYTKEEERIIAGFEEVQLFVEENGRSPQHGENKDIFERLYAVRLDRLNELKACRDLLLPIDHQGLLNTEMNGPESEPESEMDDDALLDALGVEAETGSIQELKYVRPSKEIRAAEEVAQREQCQDFEQYKSLFDQVKKDLDAGTRQMILCDNKTDVKIGDLLVLKGQNAYIANAGDEFVDNHGRPDRRLKVVFDNGTESGMLLRSFQKNLWEDENARRIITPSDLGPMFSDQVAEEDQASGIIYILRSKSDHSFIKEHRELIHKIGFTNGSVERRIADAANHPTYLLGDVEVVKTYRLYNVNASKLENLFHKLFSSAKLDIEMLDRFGKPYQPREWFLIPIEAIDEAVERLKDGSLSEYSYDSKQAKLCLRTKVT
ncbi:GIY-YIG nuclease family protein [Verrucomicrobia bacterium]|nr:GIY-YIG nuclease family protein [Verrucomicrobiota bacterium]